MARQGSLSLYREGREPPIIDELVADSLVYKQAEGRELLLEMKAGGLSL